jgi:hypothetical protein
MAILLERDIIIEVDVGSCAIFIVDLATIPLTFD